MLEKNQTITAVAHALGTNGEGVVRHEGVTFFVPACLPGEKVLFRVLKVKGNIGYGKAEEILTPAEERKLQLAETKGADSPQEENETGVVILPEVEDEK